MVRMLVCAGASVCVCVRVYALRIVSRGKILLLLILLLLLLLLLYRGVWIVQWLEHQTHD